MPFLNLDDNHADQRTVWKLSSDAFRLNISAMLFCARLQTDGLVEYDDLPRLVPKFRKALVDELVHAGLWVPLQISPGTYEIPEVLQHNRSRDEIAADRAGNRARQAAFRARRQRETLAGLGAGLRQDGPYG